jgi:RNA polymerase sigma-32 factor
MAKARQSKGVKPAAAPKKVRTSKKASAVKKSPAKKASASKALHPEVMESGPRAEFENTQDVPAIHPDDYGYDQALSDPDLDPESEVEDPRTPAARTTRVLQPEIIHPKPREKASTALSTADPIATYLAEIRRYPLLTKEQEQELAIRYRETGDAKAAELLVTSNLRFVVKVAAEYSRFGAKLIDLVQEGNVGLMHAVKEFNPYRGVRLITYAVWWIRGYIQEYLMRQYSLVRIGTTQNQRKLFYRLQRERDSLDKAGQEPNYALIAGRLGVSPEEVESMSQRLSGRDVSLSQPIGGENSTASLLDFEASHDLAADEELGHAEELQVLQENIDRIRPKLSEKETYILEKRLLSDDPQTLQEIGEHYGITREAVRQLEARLIGKLRTAIVDEL